MKTVIIRNYSTFHDRKSDTKFETRAVNIDGDGAGFVGVAAVEDSVADEHFTGRHGFLVFDENTSILAGTARNPATVSSADALKHEPTEAELDHAEDSKAEAERAQAVRDGAVFVEPRLTKAQRKQAALDAKAKADADAERAAIEAEQKNEQQSGQQGEKTDEQPPAE